MPAPKKFNPAPTTSPSYYARTPFGHRQGPLRRCPSRCRSLAGSMKRTVEIDVDEVTVVMRKISKYEARSLSAHVEPGLTIDIDERVDEVRWRSRNPLNRFVQHRWSSASGAPNRVSRGRTTTARILGGSDQASGAVGHSSDS